MNPEDDQELDDSEEALEDDEIEVTFEPRPESLAEAGITEEEFETALLAALEEHDELTAREDVNPADIPALENITLVIRGDSHRLGDLADIEIDGDLGLGG